MIRCASCASLPSTVRCKVCVDDTRLPPLAELDPEACHLGWEIQLMAFVERSTIDEAFAWVVDESDLTITPINASRSGAPDLKLETQDADPAVSGELVSERRTTDRRAADDRRGAAPAGDTSSIRVSIDKIDAFINMVGELVITQSMLSTDRRRFRYEQVAEAARRPRHAGTQHP